tara:strand:- start:50 stop:271 length:222 start_codon:yes stop_codon:yes gene_type:complete
MSNQTFGRAARAAWDEMNRPQRDIDANIAPNGEWYAIDRNIYDGAPDAGRAGAMGWGKTEAEAVADLIEQLES